MNMMLFEHLCVNYALGPAERRIAYRLSRADWAVHAAFAAGPNLSVGDDLQWAAAARALAPQVIAEARGLVMDIAEARSEITSGEAAAMLAAVANLRRFAADLRESVAKVSGQYALPAPARVCAR